MSLILEALRKSEAERQRGRAPGLFVEQQGLHRREGRRPPAWALVLTGLVVVLGAGWGWREWSRVPDVAEVAEVADVVAPTAAPAVAPAPAPAPVVSPVVSPSSAPPPPPTPADPTARPLPPSTLDPATLPVLPATTPDPAAEVVAADVAAVPATTTDDGRRTTDALPPAPPTPAAPPEESLPRLADLPSGERAALPPLRLSMHVYSDDPARRFVIVDEQRLTEGASPATGLVVEQIRRDGAVLSFNGRRVLLPRP